MFLLQTTINLGDVVAQSVESHWYNDNWVGFVLTGITGILSALIAIWVIRYDHKRQRQSKEKEDAQIEAAALALRQKQIKDLRNYFFEMCDSVVIAVEDQIVINKGIIKQITETKYESIVKKQIFYMNLDKVYYISPTQAFDLFVTELSGDSKENVKRFIEIYKCFDRIQGVRKIDDETSTMVDSKINEKISAFFSIVQSIDSFKRKLCEDIFLEKQNPFKPFAKRLNDLFLNFAIAAKKLKIENNKVVAVNEETIPENEKVNIIKVAKTELLDKLITFFNEDENINPYRFSFLDSVNSANVMLMEYNVFIKHYKTSLENSIATLEKSKDYIAAEIKVLRGMN